MNAIQVVSRRLYELKREGRGVSRKMITKIDEELKNLQPCDPFLPPDANSARALEVVPVHEDVDCEIEGDGDPGDGALAVELRVAEEGGGAVVVAVEECCWESVKNVTMFEVITEGDLATYSWVSFSKRGIRCRLVQSIWLDS